MGKCMSACVGLESNNKVNPHNRLVQANKIKHGLGFEGQTLENLQMNYDFDEKTSQQLGRNHYKRVFKCFHKKTKQPFIVKVIDKEEFDDDELPTVWMQT